MEIKVLEKCVTATNTLKKGETVNIRNADAVRLAEAGKAEFTANGKKMQEASKEALEAKAKAKAEAKKAK